MPSDTVNILVSTGIGISVIAGIVSGVCYVLAHGFSTPRARKPKLQWFCARCTTPFRSIDGVLETEKVATCQKCERRICKKICSTRDPTNGIWTCHNCVKNTSWFKEILNAFQSRYKQYSDNKMKSSQIDEDIELIRQKEKEQIRDFVERLVAAMLGGNVDDASINRMYNDEQYDLLFERYHQDLSNALTELGSALHISIANLPVVGQSPCTAHANLKQIIEKILKDAANLSNLSQRVEEQPAGEEGRMYEDLLATAILNKVVSNAQFNQPSSSAASVSSRFSTSSRKRYKRENFLGDENLQENSRNNDFETTSVSSLEEWLHSDSSLGSTKYINRMSLTIQQRIDGECPIESEDESEDERDYLLETSSLSNENWYLQKRGIDSRSPVPVPMLVPDPTTEAKVLIGDREVEDTSDLSDVASDFESEEAIGGVNSLLVRSKMIIGGKNPLSSLETSLDTNILSDDEQSSSDSGVREDRSELADEEKCYRVTAVHKVGVEEENIPDSSLNSINSKTERDAEYTEKYVALPIRTTDDTRSVRTDDVNMDKADLDKKKSQTEQDECLEEETVEFEGSYSKKDKEKWKNPIEMQNNPYSKENIEKRIQSSKTFGRDYYARQASSPSGSKSHEKSITNWINRSYDEGPEDEIDHSSLVTAIPAVIDSDRSENEINGIEVASDSDLSLVNCYDVENSKIYRKTSNGSEHELIIKVNTEGLLYTPKDDEFSARIEEEPKIPTPQVNKKEVAIRKTVNSAGLLYNPKLCADTNENTDKEVKIVKSVNAEGLLNKSELIASPGIDKEELKFDQSDAEVKPITYTKVNTEGLLYNPEENVLNSSDNDIIERDENHNTVKTVPQVQPRSFVTSPRATSTPIATKRNKLADLSFESDDKVDDFNTAPKVITKKLDNTLIKKIYSNPVVRSFALINREQIPISNYDDTTTFKKQSDTPLQNQKSFDEGTKTPPTTPIKETPTNISSDDINNILLNSTYSFENIVNESNDESGFSLEYSDNSGTFARQGSIVKDPEISELKEKKLVASRLGEFSKSFPNLRKLPLDTEIRQIEKQKSVFLFEETSDTESTNNETAAPLQERTVSVRDLRRMFENKSTPNERPVHSLTARSISKQMREELRNQHQSKSVNLYESEA